MFEVLLQADNALASGALDQAEESYWQLMELDPANAIAVTGLARVALERGDQPLARIFAERALVMDPDSFAAKRIIETLEGREVKPPASDEPDLPLLAAQRLEALGRRRATGHADAGTPEDALTTEGDSEEAGKPLPQLPAEPLWERRQAGRQAAAAAAGAAESAPRPQAPRGAKSHQALGDRVRRRLSPEAPKPPSHADDPFAVAESAAAIEAVDEADYVAFEQPSGPAEGAAQAEDLGQVLDEAEATDEDESIATQVALVSDQLQAAELDAAELEAAELGAAEPIESIGPARAELDLRTSESADDDAALAAAELASAELAMAQRVSEQIAEAEFEAARLEAPGAPFERPTRPDPRPATAQEGTEEDAEAAALREALAAVLDSDDSDAPTDDGERAPHGPEATAAQPSADHDIESPAEGSDDGGGTAGSEATPQRHRHWLLRRFLGD